MYALSKLDYQAILFVRFLHDHIFPENLSDGIAETTFDDFLAQVANLGDFLGEGFTLFFISIGFFAVGYLWKKNIYRLVGIDSFIAYVVAGLIVQIPKHVVGRPRPRLTHQENFQFDLSFQSGFDAFPSGHASASFAVATVFTRYFPQMAWFFYATASFIALSRFIRGSHFPTDILAGALLGYLVGFVVARPLKEWRCSLHEGLPLALPLLLTGFMLFWVPFHQTITGTFAFWIELVGFFLLFGGIAMRWNFILKARYTKIPWKDMLLYGELLIGIGIAFTTHSPVVMLLMSLAVLVWWMKFFGEKETIDQQSVAQEVLFGLFAIGLAVLFHSLNGIVYLG